MSSTLTNTLNILSALLTSVWIAAWWLSVALGSLSAIFLVRVRAIEREWQELSAKEIKRRLNA